MHKDVILITDDGITPHRLSDIRENLESNFELEPRDTPYSFVNKTDKIVGSREDLLAWKALGECVDQETIVFFPKNIKGVRAAKAICNECVVKEDCLEFAIDNREDFGIWGGTSERERRKIIKLRKNNK